MANSNADPTKARQAKRARRKPRDLAALLGKLWGAVEAAEELLTHEDVQVRLRAIHALAQTGSAYARAYEAGELEARLKALEEANEALTGPQVPGRAA